MGTKLDMLFVEGKKKALTLSYDDGTVFDRKLVPLMNQYGIRGTFNLNSGLFSNVDKVLVNGVMTDFIRIGEEEVKDLYEGHEIASHTLTHPSLTGLPSNMGAQEVIKDRNNLEELTDELVRGFAYPYGTYNEMVEEVLSACGMEYARTVVSTNKFELPQDFLEWHPTCHHDAPELMKLAEEFCKEDGKPGQVFYLWGHSYEFDRHNNWTVIEEFCSYMSRYKKDIWMATNIEIVGYVKAFKELRRSTDGKILFNPTGMDLWFETDGQVYCIHGNEKMVLMEN